MTVKQAYSAKSYLCGAYGANMTLQSPTLTGPLRDVRPFGPVTTTENDEKNDDDDVVIQVHAHNSMLNYVDDCSAVVMIRPIWLLLHNLAFLFFSFLLFCI